VFLRGELSEFKVMFSTNKMYVARLPIPRVVVGMVNLQAAPTFFVTDFADEAIFTFASRKEIINHIMLIYLKTVRHLYFSPHFPFLHGLRLS
jgi:hypothetical protein